MITETFEKDLEELLTVLDNKNDDLFHHHFEHERYIRTLTSFLNYSKKLEELQNILDLDLNTKKHNKLFKVQKPHGRTK